MSLCLFIFNIFVFNLGCFFLVVVHVWVSYVAYPNMLGPKGFAVVVVVVVVVLV